MKRIVCVWLPNGSIQRLVAARPELKGRAILLYARDPRRGLYVAACSSAARRGGVRLGMPAAEATALFERALAGLHAEQLEPTVERLHLVAAVGRVV